MELSKGLAAYRAQMKDAIGLDILDHGFTKEESQRIFKYVHQFLPQVAHVEARTINPTGNQPIYMRIYTPTTLQTRRAVILYHGGGWRGGSLDTIELPARELAERLGCKVFSVTYRLAPEHKFPRGLEDCYQAALWIAEHAEAYDIDPKHLMGIGESAGANLVTAVAIKLEDEHADFQFDKVVLFYPALDGRVLTNDTDENYPSMNRFKDGPQISRGSMQSCYDMYVEETQEVHHPYVSPVLAQDLSAFPATIIYAAELDPLCDEGVTFGHQLADQGVAVTTKVMPKLIHAFFLYPLEELDAVYQELNDFNQS
ncbi:alpha/beta hydrolase [Staphylococcus pettenkoferi]|uniref:alpha/beta hydrolase n=1 Tax=Staphylococcus pettenkoferi TaxID=170573 RepID=UPI002274ED88|nr:alpha/beta hydrolase [Staphylococcus pettenkoferi]MCY1576007.1 alpha/beta hydrolase [Staphylococcus pettenkoferi]MCY1617727.1 alpha/beta hydrolase [Staphylococcus pettenkoferi]